MDWRWIEPAELTSAIAAEPERFTPWLKLEWERLNADFADLAASLACILG